MFASVVRVNAHRAPHIRVRVSYAAHHVGLGEPGADGHHFPYPGRGGIGEQHRALGEIEIVQMAV